MSLPPHEGSRDTREGLVISKYPDVCRSPTAPVPYTIVAWQSDDANTAASVRMTGQRAHKQNSLITRCTGDEPGTGLGVRSNTVTSICHRKEHSRTVRIEGQWATRHRDEWYMNNRNTLGKLNWYTGDKSFEPTPPIRYAALNTGAMSDASPDGDSPRVQLAQATAAAPAAAPQVSPANPVPRPNAPNPITPRNPQPGRQPATPPAPANDNPKPAPSSRWWANPFNVIGNLAIQGYLYDKLWKRWQTMPERLKEAQRRDGVIPDQQQIRGQLEQQFKNTDFGRDYPGSFEDFGKLSPQEQQAAIERWKAEQQRRRSDAERDAPPVPNRRTDQVVSTRNRRRQRRNCRLRPYKEGCADALPYSTPHHVVPDRAFRSGSGQYYRGGVPHADGLLICVEGGTPIRRGPNINEHGRIHAIYDPLEKGLGQRGTPTGTAPLGALEALGVSSAAAVTKCNPAEMARQLRAYHGGRGLTPATRFRADPTGKVKIDPNSVGTGATPVTRMGR